MEEIRRCISPYPPVNRTDPDQHFRFLKSAHNGPGSRGALRSLQHTGFVLTITLTVVTHFANDHLVRSFQSVFGNRNNARQLNVRGNTRMTFVSFSDCCDLPSLAGQVINTCFERLCPTDAGKCTGQKKTGCCNYSPANSGHDPLQAIDDHVLASAINPVTRITQPRQDVAMIIQLAVQRRCKDRNIRVSLGKCSNPLGSGQQANKLNLFGLILF